MMLYSLVPFFIQTESVTKTLKTPTKVPKIEQDGGVGLF